MKGWYVWRCELCGNVMWRKVVGFWKYWMREKCDECGSENVKLVKFSEKEGE